MSTPSPLPSPIQTRAGSSKIWPQSRADSKILIHSNQTPKERNVQKRHSHLLSPDSSPLSLSKPTPSTTSPQRPSTPASTTPVPFHSIEGCEFHSAEKPNISTFGHEPATPSSTVHKPFGSLGISTEEDPHDGEDGEYNLPSSVDHSTQKHHSSNRGATGHSPSTMILTSTSATLYTKEADRSSSPPQDERHNSNSDLESLHSFESTDTEGDLEGPLVQCVHNNSATRTTYWKRQFNPQDLIDLSRPALEFLPFGTRTKFLAALEEVFISWRDNIDSLTISTGVDSTPPSFSSTEAQAGSNSQYTHSKKRSREPSHESGDEKSGEDDRSPHQKKRVNTGKSVDKDRRWACPFYQHDHRRYFKQTEYGDFTNCAKSSGFENVSRVKSHLWNFHCPIYCRRCGTIFKKDDELTAHQQSISDRCEVRLPQGIQGLTAAQRDALRPRDRNKSQEERWTKIYKICFPDATKIPDPYYVHYSREVDQIIDNIKTGVFGVVEEFFEPRREILSWCSHNHDELKRRLNAEFNRQGLGNITGNATRQPNPVPRKPELPALFNIASQPEAVLTWEHQCEFNDQDMDLQNPDSAENFFPADNGPFNDENYAVPTHCTGTIQPHQTTHPPNSGQNYGSSSSSTMWNTDFPPPPLDFSIFPDVSDGVDNMDTSGPR